MSALDLAAEQPAIYNSDAHLAQLVISPYTTLPAEQPAVFNYKLTDTFNIISAPLSDLDRQNDALAVIQEVSSLFQALSEAQPGSGNVQSRYFDNPQQPSYIFSH